jgi:hypothetical protein
MISCEQIDLAFKKRLRPIRLIDAHEPATPEQIDALWFSGRDWHDVTWNDWESHPDAFYAFIPEAFIYYLPSILSVTAKNPGKWLGAADALLGILNRSPEAYHWDGFIEKRLVGLESEEYEAMKAWVISLSGTNIFGDEDALARSYETVDLLKLETERVRQLVRSS